MVAEEADTRSIVHWNIFANVLLVENRSHRCDVLMAETQIDTSKTRVARLDGFHADRAPGRDHVPSKDFLSDGHSLCGADTLVRRLDRRQKNLPLHPRNIEGKQPAILNHLLRDLVLPGGEFTEGDFFSCANPLDQRKIGRSQQPEVLAVLLVDALNVLRNRDLNPGAHLRIRRLLAARAFAATLSAHRAHEAAVLDIAAPNRQSVAAPQANIGNFAKRPVRVEAA